MWSPLLLYLKSPVFLRHDFLKSVEFPVTSPWILFSLLPYWSKPSSWSASRENRRVQSTGSEHGLLPCVKKSLWTDFLKLLPSAAKSLQSCPTLCNPIDGSPPGSSVPGILQARTLEWVAISFSNAGKWKVKGKSLSRVRLLATPWTAAYQAPPSMGFSRQEYCSGVPLPSPLEAWVKSYYKKLPNTAQFLFCDTQTIIKLKECCRERGHRPCWVQPSRSADKETEI